MSDALFESGLSGLTRISQGKVRDIYAVDQNHLLIVTTDRLSAFDVVLPDPIPGKGCVLNELTDFWMNETRALVANHMTDVPLASVVTDADELATILGRAAIVRRLKPLPIEAVVRGYLIGSGWKDYQANGAVCGIDLPSGLQLAEKLPEPIFTPATKAELGAHDENISYADVEALTGAGLAARVRTLSLEIYSRGAAHAAARGIIVADTKFEFGLDNDGELVLIDEVLTPDSSRFWPADEYVVGVSPPSFDKQFVRDYLETLDWDKTAPGPHLPDTIVRKTAGKYRLAADLLKGPPTA